MVFPKMVVALILVSASSVAPSASAAPQPGGSCSPPGAKSDPFTCSGRDGVWVNMAIQGVRSGQPCLDFGDVTYGGPSGELLLKCGHTPAGLAWAALY